MSRPHLNTIQMQRDWTRLIGHMTSSEKHFFSFRFFTITTSPAGKGEGKARSFVAPSRIESISTNNEILE